MSHNEIYISCFPLAPQLSQNGFVGDITWEGTSGIVVPLYSCTPIANTLVRDCGMGIGGCHFMVVTAARRGTWAAPISRARVPLGARKVTA